MITETHIFTFQNIKKDEQTPYAIHDHIIYFED
jgi:hypothetical protein